MSAIKRRYECNGVITLERSLDHTNTNHLEDIMTTAIAEINTATVINDKFANDTVESFAIYGMPEPEGCGRTGCVRIACGLDDFRDYGSGFNDGGRAYDDNLDPRDLAPMPARPMTDEDCAYMRGVHNGWLNAQWHADMMCVIDDEPDTGEEAWLGRDDSSAMDTDQPEPGEGRQYGPDDECAWMEHHDDDGRYAEGVFHVTEPEDIHG